MSKKAPSIKPIAQILRDKLYQFWPTIQVSIYLASAILGHMNFMNSRSQWIKSSIDHFASSVGHSAAFVNLLERALLTMSMASVVGLVVGFVYVAAFHYGFNGRSASAYARNIFLLVLIPFALGGAAGIDY